MYSVNTNQIYPFHNYILGLLLSGHALCQLSNYKHIYPNLVQSVNCAILYLHDTN